MQDTFHGVYLNLTPTSTGVKAREVTSHYMWTEAADAPYMLTCAGTYEAFFNQFEGCIVAPPNWLAYH